MHMYNELDRKLILATIMFIVGAILLVLFKGTFDVIGAHLMNQINVIFSQAFNQSLGL